ncbi:MAG: hypothetical protein N2Z74_01265 [Syntrophales bacterium]|nr:hypothetical protein [Syntrophales bacterium]
MDETKTVLTEVADSAYNAADMPFDFVAEGTLTALVCETDQSLRERLTAALKGEGYQVTEATGTRDALKKVRFHIFDLVVVNELFDTTNPDANDLLTYFSALPMATRRKMFIVLVTERFRTMDNMAAFNKSVNLILNTKNINDAAAIIKKGVADYTAFYRVFMDTLRKMGKV